MSLGITTYSACNAKGLYRNGALYYENSSSLPFEVFAKEAYRYIDPAYAKFFKMDELCKLAFLTAEVLLKDRELPRTAEGADIALILGNKNSSHASDHRHYEAYHDRQQYFPGPAVFVYTLPNIMLGELCIRHQISGENTCFMMDNMDTAFLYRYVKDLFDNEHYSHCITGWVDYCDGRYQAEMFLIEKGEDVSITNKFGPNFSNLIPD